MTAKQVVPSKILLPTYIVNSEEYDQEIPKEPEIKNLDQIRKMQKSCSLARYILDSVSKNLKVSLCFIFSL